MDLSPSALRHAYLSGQTTPVDVLTYVLSRLPDPDQQNVWISTVDPTKALAAAATLNSRISQIDDMPLFGLPFSVKDNIDVAGEPTTAACPDFSYIAETSAHVVEEAIKAGGIYIGKTNMDQFATGLVGVRSPYGTPRNPFNPDYIPGGSSSGAGVSVATGAVSFAFGTDTGGSGRVPASYNGIVGLKPAPGELSKRGLVYACRSIDTPSIFARTGADALRVFDAVRSRDPSDPYMIAPAPFTPRAGIRLASPQREDLQFFDNAETEHMFHQALDKVTGLFGPIARVDFKPFTSLNNLLFFGPLLAERDASVGAFIDVHPQACDPTVRNLVLGSRKMTAADAYRAQHQIADAKAAMSAFWRDHDVLMVPTVGDVLTTAKVLADPLQPNFNNGYYTNYANPLGLCAVATPFGTTSDGVPWGVTFLSTSGSIEVLTKLADAFTFGAVPDEGLV